MALSKTSPPALGAAAALGLPKTYLAYAAVAPPTHAVKHAVTRTLERLGELGPAAFPVFAAEREALREDIARLIHARPEDIAFTSGTTRGITSLALCIPWRTGERVVLFSGEFPANVTPWQQAAKLFGLDVRFVSLARAVDDLDGVLRELEGILAQGARLVAVSAVQFQTGLRMPLDRIAALCHRYGAELAVDGIQALGAVPLDVDALGVDYLACGAHKWMMGIDGVGFLYVAPRVARDLQPRTCGWLSHEHGIAFLTGSSGQLRYDRPILRAPAFFEGSSLSHTGLAALAASVRAILEIGESAIFAHISRYLDTLDAGLAARGIPTLRAKQPEARSGILSFAPPAGLDAATIARALRERGVVVSTPDGLVRLAPHYPNPEDEPAAVLEAIDDALRELRT